MPRLERSTDTCFYDGISLLDTTHLRCRVEGQGLRPEIGCGILVGLAHIEKTVNVDGLCESCSSPSIKEQRRMESSRR